MDGSLPRNHFSWGGSYDLATPILKVTPDSPELLFPVSPGCCRNHPALAFRSSAKSQKKTITDTYPSLFASMRLPPPIRCVLCYTRYAWLPPRSPEQEVFEPSNSLPLQMRNSEYHSSKNPKPASAFTRFRVSQILGLSVRAYHAGKEAKNLFFVLNVVCNRHQKNPGLVLFFLFFPSSWVLLR
jgi:hypothetical protein